MRTDKPELVMNVGDTFEFVIMSREDENGQLFLSRRRILFQEAWDKVRPRTPPQAPPPSCKAHAESST